MAPSLALIVDARGEAREWRPVARSSPSSAEQPGPKPVWAGITDNIRAARQIGAVELNGGSTESLSVGPAHVANRADSLPRRASGGEIKLQFQNFSDTPLPSHFNEHPADAEIY